ncbi:MAG: hypothetical protein H0T57_10070 [Rubrobacter sp.]|nr:hypothetical protein [Rubrobacter sp.]
MQPALPYPGRDLVGAREGAGRMIHSIFAGVLLAGAPVYALLFILPG